MSAAQWFGVALIVVPFVTAMVWVGLDVGWDAVAWIVGSLLLAFSWSYAVVWLLTGGAS